ncbi:MAG: Ig-like domain-containing protein, partial [Casimicrobiaceae bacterium]
MSKLRRSLAVPLLAAALGSPVAALAQLAADEGFEAIPLYIGVYVNERTPKNFSLAPPPPAIVAVGANVTLSSSPTVAKGAITSVEYLRDSTSLGLGTNNFGTYQRAWSPSAAGTYSLTAKATASSGYSRTSSASTVRVCAPPVVSVYTVPGASVPVNSQVALKADVASPANACAITSVRFYAQGIANPIGTVTGSSLAPTATFSPWTPTVVQTYSITAQATDQLGLVTTSAPVALAVTAGPNAPPVITGVSPLSAQGAVGGSVTFQVTATDPNDTLTVTLLNGATVLASTTTGTANVYTLSWTPAAAGTYNLTVRVTDSGGLSASQNVQATITGSTGTVGDADPVIPSSYDTPGIGSIAGTFSVSEGGGASYTLPIHVPPGTAGMQPNLALSYNSQGGNGLLGVGWSLSGLSSITRCPKTEAQDGMRLGINYNNTNFDDAYCLDGQRLIQVGGPVPLQDTNYNASGIAAYKYEYRTEIDSFARIEAFREQVQDEGSLVIGPYRFRVWTKSGQIADYGSRFWIVTAGWTQGGGRNGSLQPRLNAPKSWVLDRVLDRSGNFMEIDYADRPAENVANGIPDPTAGLNLLHLPGNCAYTPGNSPSAMQTPIGALPTIEFWPTAIRYYASGAVSSECGNSTNHQVKFVYNDVPSQVALANRDRYYDAGQGQTTLSKRLVEIRTSIDGVGLTEGYTVHSYQLAYASSQQTGRSLLQAVTQCGADGVCLPPTRFDWAANDPAAGWDATGKRFNFVNLTGLPFGIDRHAHSNNGVYVVDWNGDGKSDIIGWKHEYTATSGLYRHSLIVCL